ncbi:hypothetical protein NOC27_2671 [Nitrosococcus oceani AFC27]|nr:hypothetical protein NOC27_2671 [Nitrosococcus oceani AFC27]
MAQSSMGPLAFTAARKEMLPISSTFISLPLLFPLPPFQLFP